MTETGPPAPPGWYADPRQAGQLRWWDGNAWTEQVHAVPPSTPLPTPQVRYVVPGADHRPGDPADFVSRLGAALVEGAIWFGLQFTAMFPVALIAGLLAVMGAEWLGFLLTFVLVGLGPWLVQLWLEAAPQGQVYGKHLLRLAVVDARTGLPGIGLGRSVSRQLAKIVSALPLGLGFLWPLWDAQRRTWHDMMTSTRVVRTEQERILDPVTFLRRTGVPAITTSPQHTSAMSAPDEGGSI